MANLPEAVVGARVAGSRVLQAARKADPEGRMPLMGHLRELRNRIVKAALAIAGGMVLGFVFFGPIWAVVTHPFCSAVISGHTGCKTQGDQLVVTGIFDPFMVRVQVAFFVGLIATSPVWLCVVLVEIAEVIVWANDRRRARIPDPYAGLADNDLAPLEMGDELRTAPSDHSLS